MGAAPEMLPGLDTALQAMDRVLRSSPAAPSPDLLPVSRFLDQLDEVRNVPAVMLDRAQAELMEGAYLAGVRCADESGHVLVMSLPAFLALHAPAPASRTVPDVPTLLWGAVCVAAAGAAVTLGTLEATGLFLLAAATWLVGAFLRMLPPSPCNQDCDAGRQCPSRSEVADAAATWRKRALEAEARLDPPPMPASVPKCAFPYCVCSPEKMAAGCGTGWRP